MVSHDGLNFPHKATDFLKFRDNSWGEDVFTHNLAVARLGANQYAMVGGKQGFVSNRSCRVRLRNAEFVGPTRERCLKRLEEPPTGSGSPLPTGIRLSRGSGLPWSSEKWSPPRTVITGVSPANCVDRRPRFTGWPRLQACEFDGRLSLVRLGEVYHLYARASLKFGAIAGGRSVQVAHNCPEQLQVTRSPH
jgi:hypothetical protein